MNTVKAAIFDIDGLMIDSEAIQTKSFEEILIEYGKKPIKNNKGVVHNVGAGAVEIWKILKKKYNISESEDILAGKSKVAYLRIFKEELQVLKPMPGLLKILDLLKKNNFKLGIVSGGQHVYINSVIKNLGIKDYFNTFVSGWDVKRQKPYPDSYLLAAEKLGIPPNECLVFEDADSGVLAAHSAGMKVIAVPNRYTIEHNFTKADKIVSSLEKINLHVINSL